MKFFWGAVAIAATLNVVGAWMLYSGSRDEATVLAGAALYVLVMSVVMRKFFYRA